ncbi:MAG: hypothetical protein ACO3RV_02920 [Luteolibacter sp.]
MTAQASTSRNHDATLWWVALLFSLLVNVLVLLLAGRAAIEFRKVQSAIRSQAQSDPQDAWIVIEPPASSARAKAEPPKKRFARTSADQAAPAPENPAFMGERSTRASSDRRPDPNAAAMPSQAGVKPRDADDIETTESVYQDGEIKNSATPASAESEEKPSQVTAETDTPRATAPAASAARDPLLDGPTPVDIPVTPPTDIADKIKSAEKLADLSETPPSPQSEETHDDNTTHAAQSSPADRVFQGNQRKTAIVGSISRNGRSSLDVEDSAMGRYQAAISRAVELEWQRNCVRHRDFIMPGFLTVRFFVEKSGRVRSVQFVGEMETGEVQKGFTLNSIREAAIPPMPKQLANEFDGEPLELIFRFYF